MVDSTSSTTAQQQQTTIPERLASDFGSNMTSVAENNDTANDANAQKDVVATPEHQYPGIAKLSLTLFSICTTVFLVALDQTIIAPALGAITGHFNSTKDIGWYGAAYLLTTTCLQPTYGVIYRQFHVKWTYLFAILVFEIGSLICAVAPSSVVFIVGRAVAGMGTAGIFAGGIVIISHSMPLQKRSLAFGLIGGMWGIASVAGPLLGGAFTENVTWRWCFYINLPVGGLAMGIVFLVVKVSRNTAKVANQSMKERLARLDFYGMSMFIPGIICLLLALQWGGSMYAWKNSRIIGLFVGAGAMLAIFAGIQVWRGERSTLPPTIFKQKSIISAIFFGFSFGGGFFPLIYYLSLYFQAIQGVSAVQAGIKILPLLLSTVVTSVFTGATVPRIGYYNFIVIPCMVLFAIGAGMITTFDIHTPLREWFGYQVLAGLGIGVGFQVGPLVVQTVLEQDWIPVGTASVQFFQSLGGAIFIAVAQTVFQNGFISQVRKDNIGIDPQIFLHSGASEVRAILRRMHREDALDTVLKAYMKGLRNTYYITVALAICAFFAAISFEWRSVKDPQRNATKSNSSSETEQNPEPKAVDESV